MQSLRQTESGRGTPLSMSGERRTKAALIVRQRLSVTGAGDKFSDGEDVVVRFFLIRYHSIVASRTEISFARQFSRVSLVRRIEINFVRQLFISVSS